MTKNLPPHSLEAEQSTLATALEFPGVLASFASRPVDFFHDLRHATLFATMKELKKEGVLIDSVTVFQRLKDQRKLKLVGGATYLSELSAKSGSEANLPYWIALLNEKYALRKLQQICREADFKISAEREASGAALKSLLVGIQADLDTVSRVGQDDSRKPVCVWNASQLAGYEIPADMMLVGDNEIVRGYEGVTVMAGPGSSGKSLAAMALALAGAKGDGFWMGRKVHRKFRTLIIQAENGLVRLKTEFEALKRNHPDLPLDDHIFISEPPEGGLPFHRGNFRAELRSIVDRLKPDLVVVRYCRSVIFT